jgi:O-antigen/teichoic acid export membrane protein
MSKSFTVKLAYIFYLLYFLAIPFGFLTRILYSHSLTQTQFGIIYALYSFFGLFHIISNFGFSSALKYFIPIYYMKKDFNNLKNIFYYAFILQQFLSIVFSLFFYLFSKFIVTNYFHNLEILIYFKMFIIYFIFLNLMNLFSDFLISLKKTTISQVIYLINLVLIFLFSFLFFYFFSKKLLFYYIIIIALVYFISFLLLFYFSFKNNNFLFSLPNYDSNLFKEFFLYSLGIFMFNIGMTILLQIDVIVITYFLSVDFVGIYTNSSVLINTMVTSFSAISIMLMPYFTEFKEKGDFKSISIYLNLIYNLFLFITIPFSLIFLLFPKQILTLLFGNQYVVGYLVLIILSTFSIFKIIFSYNLVFISSFGLVNNLIKIIFPVVFFNLFFDILLIKKFGIEGVAVITGISWFLIYIFTLRILLKKIKDFKLDYLKYVKIIILNILFVFIVLGFKKIHFFSNYYLNSSFILIISFLIYFYLGNLFKIYKFNELLIFIPNEKLKIKIKKFYNRYLTFLN